MSDQNLPTTFTVNVAGANKLMPAGIYLLNLSSFEVKMGPSGSPYLAWTLTVICDEEEDTEFAGRKLFSNVSFSEKAKFFLSRFLLAVGYDEELLESGEFEFNPDDVLHEDVYAAVGIGKDNKGNDRNEIESFVVPDFSDDVDQSDQATEEAFSVTGTDDEVTDQLSVEEDEIQEETKDGDDDES